MSSIGNDYTTMEKIKDLLEADSSIRDLQTTVEIIIPPPGPDACPYVAVVPTEKPHELKRLGASTSRYDTYPTYDLVCYVAVVDDPREAFKELEVLQRYVATVLKGNPSLGGYVESSKLLGMKWDLEEHEQSLTYMVSRITFETQKIE